MDKKILEQQMQLMQKGSEQAFEVVYNMTKKHVFFTIYAILKDYGLSEELMQDTYIKVRTTIYQYKKNTYALAWILTIARNLAINVYHKRKRELISDELENDFLFHATNEDTMNNNLLVQKLLIHLNLDERQVVSLYMAGFKHREIAAQLDKPLGTVLWLYNKAIKQLQKEVGACER